MSHPKMQFTLNGFSQEQDDRVFVFDGVAADRSRVSFTVRIDMTAARRYGIRQQELPLLCRGLLDRCHEEAADQQHVFVFAEDEMCRHSQAAAAREQAAKNRKPPRRPSPAAQTASAQQSPWHSPYPRV